MTAPVVACDADCDPDPVYIAKLDTACDTACDTALTENTAAAAPCDADCDSPASEMTGSDPRIGRANANLGGPRLPNKNRLGSTHYTVDSIRYWWS